MLDPGESVNVDLLPLRGSSLVRCVTPVSWIHFACPLLNLFVVPAMVPNSFSLLYHSICGINDIGIRKE